MNFVEISTFASDEKYVKIPFYKDGKPVHESVFWGMTLRSAGSMRFRWNEENPLRTKTLSEIACGREIAAVQLDHTKIVYKADSADDVFQKIGDGIVTKNKNLMPVVTVADCMPIYFYDSKSGFFGVVHSGWKGTGIAFEALNIAQSEFGAKIENICVALGPHIRNCCYVVNQERADYFRRNFTEDCVRPVSAGEIRCKGTAALWNSGNGPLFRLSLEMANLALLRKAGICEENIVVAKDCTCCNGIFGSNRRETSSGNSFTVQAAFVINSE